MQANLFSFLTGKPNKNGTWTLLSGGPTLISTCSGLGCDEWDTEIVSNGDQVGIGHNVFINTEESNEGTYIFRYTVEANGCSHTADITVQVCSEQILPLTSCIYYQDLGDTVSPSTISLINITSVIFDGIQYVTTPIPLGNTPNIISINGLNYVTNLVDRLNELNIPNVAFDYTTEVLTDDGKTNGFKIVRPIGMDFYIETEQPNLQWHYYPGFNFPHYYDTIGEQWLPYECQGFFVYFSANGLWEPRCQATNCTS